MDDDTKDTGRSKNEVKLGGRGKSYRCARCGFVIVITGKGDAASIGWSNLDETRGTGVCVSC